MASCITERPALLCCGLCVCPHLYHDASSILPNSSTRLEEVNHLLECSCLFCFLQLSPVYAPVLILIPLVLSFIPPNTFRSPGVKAHNVSQDPRRLSGSHYFSLLTSAQPPSLCFSFENWRALCLVLHPTTNMPPHRASQRSRN